jgi:hypothetical protein
MSFFQSYLHYCSGYTSVVSLTYTNEAATTKFLSFFFNRPLLPCGVEGFLLVNLLDNW